jgi:hypothetical protein
MIRRSLAVALTLVFVLLPIVTTAIGEERRIIQVNYPFEKFEKVINRFVKDQDFTVIFLETKDGIHGTTLSKNLFHIVFIMAESRKNKSADYFNNYKRFTFKNKTCYYYFKPGKNGKRGTGSLVVEYPEFDTYISINSTMNTGKEEMLSLFDKLDF